jgi:hypothetical protein
MTDRFLMAIFLTSLCEKYGHFVQLLHAMAHKLSMMNNLRDYFLEEDSLFFENRNLQKNCADLVVKHKTVDKKISGVFIAMTWDILF